MTTPLIMLALLASPWALGRALGKPGWSAWGPVYLWIRIPLQSVLIAAVWGWSIRSGRPVAGSGAHKVQA